MSSITTDVEDAIYSWVVAGSQLAADHVIWSEERGPQPEGCYISMRLSDERPYGLDWTAITDVEFSDPGEELEFTATGPRLVKLTLECFAAGDAWATSKPDRKLARIISARALPTIADALRSARVGVGPIQPVQSLNLERSKLFEPRAMVEITLHLMSEISERGTYIETVEIEPTYDGIEQPTITVTQKRLYAGSGAFVLTGSGVTFLP